MDNAIEAAILKVVEPSAITAAIEADAQQATRRDEIREALLRDLEVMRYAADRASDNMTRPIPPIAWWRQSWNYAGTKH